MSLFMVVGFNFSVYVNTYINKEIKIFKITFDKMFVLGSE